MDDDWTRRRVLVSGAALAASAALAACDPRPSGRAPGVPVRPLPVLDSGPSPWASAPQVDLGSGAWCWFSTPRSVVDAAGMLWAGAAITDEDQPTRGAVVVNQVDLRTGRLVTQYEVGRTSQPDDHAHAGVSLPGGASASIQVGFAPHSNFTENGFLAIGGVTSMRQVLTATPGQAYAGAAVLDGVRYVLTRRTTGWILLRSADGGQSWEDLGRTVTPVASDRRGYKDLRQRPYHLMAAGPGGLHVVISDGNPNEFPGSSVYHGIVRSDLSITRMDGTVVGRIGTDPPVPASLSRVYDGSFQSGLDGAAWPSDIQFIQGQPTVVISARCNIAGPASSPLRYLWARPGVKGWDIQHLCWAGEGLYDTQPNYSGLGVLDPDDPYRVVVSTNSHPTTGSPLVSAADGRRHWEIWEGYRGSAREWHWQPVTADSSADNLRPHLASGGGMRALTYMVGAYAHYQRVRTAMVTRMLAA